ncbi:MAG: AI-2E family transporter [Lachnospiraceae bacterium]|nr:AI-2E family transporter [Lachnospiraceae bacterium]
MEKNNERAMNRTKRNMRTKRNLSRIKDYAPQGVVAFLVLAALMLLLFCLLNLSIFGNFIKSVFRALGPAVAGFIFAFIMSPLVRFIETKLVAFAISRNREKENNEEWMAKIRKRARRISILLTLVTLLSIITLLLVAIIPELAKSLKDLALNLAKYLEQLQGTIDSYLLRNPRVAEVFDPVVKKFSDSEKLADTITKYFNIDMAGDTAKFVFKSTWTVVRILYIWLVGTIVSVYLLASKEYYIGLCKKLFFAILPKRTSKNAIQTLHKANIIYSAAILGKLVDSLIIGMLCFIGTLIMGIWFPAIGRYKVLVSVIVGVTNVIPFFGPFLGGIPCSLLIFSIKPLEGLVFALFVVALQQFDGNFLDPHIVGKKVGLRPLYVLCACMLCGGLFGIPGLIVATPTCALVYYLVKSYLEVRLESKNLPTETKEYVTHPSAVIANRAMSVDVLTERLVAESDALDAEQAQELAKMESAAALAAATGSKRKRRRHRSGTSTLFSERENDMEETDELDLSAYDDLESGVAREKRLQREWLMSSGEEDVNENGIADELERAHEAEGRKKPSLARTLIRRMIDEAEEDWDELGNRPLPGSKRRKQEALKTQEEEDNTSDDESVDADDETLTGADEEAFADAEEEAFEEDETDDPEDDNMDEKTE